MSSLKMEHVLSDNSKFIEVNDIPFKVANKTEDKVNRLLTVTKLKENHTITEDIYTSIRSTGSSFGILYGLPKIHKGNAVPLRPILAAYNLPNFKIAKFLVPLLNDLAKNRYTIQNSYSFSSELVQCLNPDNVIVSYNVESLFTNIPLDETINIILSQLFPTNSTIYNGFSRSAFKEHLEVAVFDCHFLFNKKLYKQIDGCAMGSPLGPVLANIFMCSLETQFFRLMPRYL